MGAFSSLASSGDATTHHLHLLLLLLFVLLSAPASSFVQHEVAEAGTEPGDAANDVQWHLIPKSDVKLLEFPLNLEYLECEFFLWGSTGKGMDVVAPELVGGGPPPIGAMEANLDPFTRDVIKQFALQEVGHVRAIKYTVKGFPRPQLDLSRRNFAKIMDSAFGRRLQPPFDPYASSTNYLIASYVIPYVGLTGYVGANPRLQDPRSRRVRTGCRASGGGVRTGRHHPGAAVRAREHEGAALRHHRRRVHQPHLGAAEQAGRRRHKGRRHHRPAGVGRRGEDRGQRPSRRPLLSGLHEDAGGDIEDRVRDGVRE